MLRWEHVLWAVVFGVAGCGEAAIEELPTVLPVVTYHRDVAPILADHCLGCHTAAGIAPFALDTYSAVSALGPIIRHVTENRIMPPFNPDNSGRCNTYEDARWLDDVEIGRIAQWVYDGMPEGDPADNTSAWVPPSGLTHVKRTVSMSEPYTPDADLEDDYRCFVMDPELGVDVFLTGVDVHPGQTEMVHHVILFGMQTPEQDQQARDLAAASPGPGYRCFGDSGVDWSNVFDFPASVAAWAPGSPALVYPPGTGVRLRSGRSLVMQVHYNLQPGTLADVTAIDLDWETSVENEASIIGVAAYDLSIPPGVEEHVEADSWDLGGILPAAFDIHMVFPHMHRIGKKLRAEVTRVGETVCITDVPEWDFDWQGFHQLTSSVTVFPGDILSISCTYDSTDRSVTTEWGDGTDDEMCIAGMYVTF